MIAVNGGFFRFLEILLSTKEPEFFFCDLLKELPEIFGVSRCVVFEIRKFSGHQSCRVICGAPLNEHKMENFEELSLHPDIKFAVKSQKNFLIDNPERDERTSYFLQTIKSCKISQILYLPILVGENDDKIVTHVVVLDSIGKKFSSDQLKIGEYIQRLISLKFQHDAEIMKEMKEAIMARRPF